jgi:peptidoglycan/xylan/chitin deacetylase (PgdA/CDA1 family)
MKQEILNLMRAAGAFVPFRVANRDKALILTYHRFTENGDHETTSRRAFARQLQYLKKHYQLVSLSRLAGYMSSGNRLPKRLAAIAIDDGYRDAYEIAFPLLRAYDAPATLFVVTSFVDQTAWLWPDRTRFILTRSNGGSLVATIGSTRLEVPLDGRSSRLEAARRVNELLKTLPDDVKDEAIRQVARAVDVYLPEAPPDEYDAISWSQAREMDAAGVEIGSHTLTHPILTRVTDRRLQDELSGSRRRIEAELNRNVDLLCYPNGDYDDRVVQAARAAGYRCAVTIDPGFNATGCDLLRLRRVHTESNFARFVRHTSGFDQIRSYLTLPHSSTTGAFTSAEQS